jgi:hypothetical protein
MDEERQKLLNEVIEYLKTKPDKSATIREMKDKGVLKIPQTLGDGASGLKPLFRIDGAWVRLREYYE